ncbi:hypothetical protein H312_01831, partial [Anncaliia algerae PRA339]
SLGEHKCIKNEEKFLIDRKNHKNKDVWEWTSIHLKYFLQGIEINFEGSIILSFPLESFSLEEGKVKKICKIFPFKKETFLNTDIVKELNKQCQLKNINVQFKTVLNDAVATAVSSYFIDNSTILSVILGTGTNCAAIMKNTDDCKKIINLEWSNFDSEKIKKTDFDKAIIQQLKDQEIDFNILDVLIGGLKFVEICSMYCASKGVNNTNMLTFKNFIQVLNKREEERTDEEKIINKCIHDIKKRTLRILSALIVAVIESMNLDTNNITICLDGHAFFTNNSRMLLRTSIYKLLNKKGIGEKYEINLKFMRNSSLLGGGFSIFLLDFCKNKK